MFSLSHLKTKRYNQNDLNGVIWPKLSLENITVKYFSYTLISCSDKVCNLHRAFWVRKNQESNKYTNCQFKLNVAFKKISVAFYIYL